MTGRVRKSPDLPWKVRIYMIALTIFVDICRCSNVTRRLMNLVHPKASPSNKPRNGVVSSDVTFHPSRNLWFRLFVPSKSANDVSLPVIVYFHGGGFTVLAANSKVYDDFCRRLAGEIHAVVVSVNYRLAPDHRFPSQYEDGFDTLHFIDGWSFDGFPANIDLKRCFLAGDSAGANIAHHVALRAGECEFRELEVAGVIAIQPFFGGEARAESEVRLAGAPLISLERTDWMWKSFLPDGSDRDHPAVNVFGPKSVDISGVKFPGTVVFVGGFDPLLDWQKRYYEGLKTSGKEAYLIEYPNAMHFFYAFPELSESSLLITELKDFMQKQSTK